MSSRPVILKLCVYKFVGRYSSVGIATRYGLGSSAIELPIPVAELSKARVCGQSLAGVAGLKR